ncbi:uncharacterized protein PHALS_00903 [Plasmopara halstedii]|uniref:Uncharacterized protein n=1 Tax=Plasmopara halstedii TaxID=4781 RepID=A0A0P1AS93_PLAHL|nr:uncharacterized protein PHALS_00903 [Plasmopara halstedii]CEG44548.1 hypothetical protein PHALS_00903 [Plasmopara halstedii]|eukprot:XP_024580917.1 hypothetical protein PHALS_00903 [Plasmopara halstedii]
MDIGVYYPIFHTEAGLTAQRHAITFYVQVSKMSTQHREASNTLFRARNNCSLPKQGGRLDLS